MIERVARVIDRALTKSGTYVNPYLEQDGPTDLAVGIARAAIEAMRDPTEAMECAIHQNPEEARGYWQAMIDAALKSD